MKHYHLAHLHRQILRNLKRQCAAYRGNRSKELSNYQKVKTKYAKKKFVYCSPGTLNTRIKKSRVIYLGDFHTFDHNVKNVERILKYLLAQKIRPALAIEFIQQGMEEEIFFFLKGYITELEFLEAINYQESWKFPWEHYRIFFDYARKYQLTILPLNSPGPLHRRDQVAASAINNFLNKNPKDILIVFFGELHIMPNKLPKLVQQLNPVPITIIHQNIDDLYWKLPLSKRSGSILKFAENEYVLNTSPPWIKYESLLFWYENILDDPDFDLRSSSGRNLTTNAHEHFHELSHMIIDYFKLPKCELVEEFNLYDYRQLNIFYKKISNLNNSSIKKFYFRQIARSQLLIAPFGHEYYCSNYSINRLSYLVGIHIYHTYQKNSLGSWPLSHWSPSKCQKFLIFYYQSYLAYLTSKIINPQRKCLMYQDLKQANNNKMVIEIIDNPKKIATIIRHKSIDAYFRAAQLIGHFTAELSFNQVFNSGNHQQAARATLHVQLARILSLPVQLSDFLQDLEKILEEQNYQITKKRIF